MNEWSPNKEDIRKPRFLLLQKLKRGQRLYLRWVPDQASQRDPLHEQPAWGPDVTRPSWRLPFSECGPQDFPTSLYPSSAHPSCPGLLDPAFPPPGFMSS